MKKGYVYILINSSRTSLYIGVTNDIERRTLEHKAGVGSKHTSKYELKFLMHFETCPTMAVAIAREKQLKRWHRDWKWNLIKEFNAQLDDLASAWFDQEDIESVRGIEGI